MPQSTLDKYFNTKKRILNENSKTLKKRKKLSMHTKDSLLYVSQASQNHEKPLTNELKRSNSVSPIKSQSNNYVPKVPSGKLMKTSSFHDIINKTVKNEAIDNMNLLKTGAISYNNFNLEKIYGDGKFYFSYNDVDKKSTLKYELDDAMLPVDLHSKILFATIFTVFRNPINVGYFNESELDFIYSILSLPHNAQLLLSRMIKRKKSWFRKSQISYPETASDLKHIFQILATHSICTLDLKDINLIMILELLTADEIKKICQKLKLKCCPNKKDNIKTLLIFSEKKALFPGMKKPSDVLFSSVINILDYCVSLTEKTWVIIDKILTLIMPNSDPKMSRADIFFALSDVYLGKVMFPSIPENRFPIFSSNLHLMSYIEAKTTLSTTLQLIEGKKWKEVKDCGKLAMETLQRLINTESVRLRNSLLPVHVRRYLPVYVWFKILSLCVDAFKKDADKTQVVKVLRFLLEQDCCMHTKKGEWYCELALTEMHHNKNIEASALIIIEALSKDLTQVDIVQLIERAKRIAKKKTGLNPTIKFDINKILDEHSHQMPEHENKTNVISAALMPENTKTNKSVWCIESNSNGRSYGSVETVAVYHYYQEGFSNGLHCEGALPIIFFYTLFWEELYDVHIPGAFVTDYQYAPDDLFTGNFYENRKEKIQLKLDIINNLDSMSLSTLMEQKFQICKQFQSIMPTTLLKDNQLKEIVQCLGVQGVIGICRRLIENFKLWKAGFPDLIIWNFQSKEHKLVEVKGPKDSLSIKQRLWLEYLNQLGLNTEVCLVKAQREK
ncbi:fanconi-associated nuclease 1 isoform X2 [Megachile rotundata]|uniref:fanconi-associated nuclease 1 isoform X2 n=1 Tax=Megachile rotundata TaxID=143995 RepID=UPI000614E3A1|nr:PREDICTED: fanconi-associated nuclease 1-like [Megachile rotundata]